MRKYRLHLKFFITMQCCMYYLLKTLKHFNENLQGWSQNKQDPSALCSIFKDLVVQIIYPGNPFTSFVLLVSCLCILSSFTCLDRGKRDDMKVLGGRACSELKLPCNFPSPHFPIAKQGPEEQ